MSDTDNKSIFSSQETPEQNTGSTSTPQHTQADPFSDLLKGIQNERGEPKYRDVPTALDGLRNAQQFIEQLKAEARNKDNELATLRAEVDKLKAVQESIDKLGGIQKEAPQNNAQMLSPEAIADLVNQALTQRETQTIQKKNIEAVTQSLAAKFGEKAEEQFYSKARELGLAPQEFNALAAKSPQAVLALFGATQAHTGFVAPARSTVDTTAFSPQVESFIGRNKEQVSVGATTQELHSELERAKKMVEEIHGKGLSVHDLSDPKAYFKYFG